MTGNAIPNSVAEPERLRALAAALFEHNPSSWRTPSSEPLHLYDLRVGEEMVRQYEGYARAVLDTLGHATRNSAAKRFGQHQRREWTLLSCPECRALVLPEHEQKHREWHRG